MKSRLLFLLIVLSASAFTIHARQYKFQTNVSGACPIRVFVNGEQYWIVDASDKVVVNLSGSNNEFSAIDAFDQNMNYERYSSSGDVTIIQLGAKGWGNHGKKRVYTYRNGEVIRIDDSSSSYYEEDSDYNSGSSSSGSSTAKAAGAAIGSAGGAFLAAGLFGLFSGGTENYPNFQLQAGASHMYGEFARAKLMLGGGNGFGLVLYGGMGKEFIFNVKNEKMLDHYSGHKRTPWHAGLGAFLITDEYDNSSDLTFGITFTESPAVTNNALMLDLTWSKYFGENRRFGVFIGAGGGLGDMRDEDGKFMWDVNIGIAFKLWKN